MGAAPPTVRVDKPSIATLWLDTWVIQRLVKEVDRRRDAAEIKRLGRLQDLVLERVKAGRLLCPEADQREEYGVTSEAVESASKWARLSRGIRIRPGSDIERFELFYAREAMRAGADELHLPLRVYFDEDPVEMLNRIRKEWYVISAFTPPREAQIRRMLASKARSASDLRALRTRLIEKGTSFNAQLAKEARGSLDAFEAALEDGQALLDKSRRLGLPDPPPEVLVSHPRFNELLRNEREYDEQSDPVERVRALLESPYYLATPGKAIRTTLYADILTSSSEVDASDPADIDFLAVALPAAHFVLADRAMAHRLLKHRLGERWGAEVFSIGSIGPLMDRLEAL